MTIHSTSGVDAAAMRPRMMPVIMVSLNIQSPNFLPRSILPAPSSLPTTMDPPAPSAKQKQDTRSFTTATIALAAIASGSMCPMMTDIMVKPVPQRIWFMT